jgi:hypothetical protein
VYLLIYVVRYLLTYLLKFELLTKHFIEIQGNLLNAFGIIHFYKMVWWFDGQDIGLEQMRQRFNLPYQHRLCGICIFVYIPYTCVNV